MSEGVHVRISVHVSRLHSYTLILLWAVLLVVVIVKVQKSDGGCCVTLLCDVKNRESYFGYLRW